MRYTHTVEYFSAIKMKESGSFVGIWVDLESVTQSDKSEREQQMLYINTHMWNLEKWYKWTSLQGRNRDTDVKNRCVDMRRVGRAARLGWMYIHFVVSLLSCVLLFYDSVNCSLPDFFVHGYWSIPGSLVEKRKLVLAPTDLSPHSHPYYITYKSPVWWEPNADAGPCKLKVTLA